MKAFLQISFAALLLLFTACEKDFSIMDPEGVKKMTVNCLYNNFQGVQVFVTNSSSYTQSTSLIPIVDAAVTLYQNDTLVATLNYMPADSANSFGFYKTPFVAIPGNKYFIKVVHPQFGQVSAEDFFPEMPQVENAYLLQYQNPATNQLCKYRFRITDNASTNDYYRIHLASWNTEWSYANGDSSLQDYYDWHSYNMISPVVDSVGDHGWDVLFSDKNFNGQLKDLDFSFYVPDSSHLVHQTIYPELHHISYAQFEYYRTLQKNGYTVRSEDAQPVHNNITNGYGIFMSSAVMQTSLTIK